ncbi:putative ATP:guanido phosphotransferase [Enhygromyxa salina]|uniref:Putative ATP:guanido phosphotransferase n=1 Tax=Enhygromyxa salina TaxID=215803 RepID=A0A2S9YG98_9BACT|nr:arginine kinase [Enhygromyxa salina]PRQ04071.1 putative ATP:guanido phosphotransferase [Enhygromyxa salina]
MGNSLLSKYLTPELEGRLATRATPAGWTLSDLTRCGRAYPNCTIGVHAGDAASYEVFAPLLNPIIEHVHGRSSAAPVRGSSERARVAAHLRDDLAVLSTTVRVTRNLRSAQFPALIGRRGRLEAERRIAAALDALGPRFEGRYHPLAELPVLRRRTLDAQDLVFDDDDRYLVAAGITRDWPEGRGLWCSVDRRLVVWVNEEDHLRIISTSPSGDLPACLARVRKLAAALEELLGFHHDDRLGFLTSCPSNVGTGLRASARLRLPRLASRPKELDELVEEHGLMLRKGRGEGIFVVGNRRCLGASEVESVERLAEGVCELLTVERAA